MSLDDRINMATNSDDMDMRAAAHQIFALAYNMRGNPLSIVDCLEGYLFDEEECGELKELLKGMCDEFR